MSKPNKTILFIEDEEIHYNQVAAYLKQQGYECQCLGIERFRDVRQEALKHQPVAAVVDCVLLSTTPQPKTDEEHYGVKSIPILREVCPGIKILLYTQLADRDQASRQAGFCRAHAGLPKQLDPHKSGYLLESNAHEIADKVRDLIK